MKLGKVSETVLKRSILKQISTSRKEVLIGAGLCRDSAIIEISKENVVALSCNSYSMLGKDAETIVLNSSINNVAASGAKPIGILIDLILPVLFEEANIKIIMKNFDLECVKQNIQIIGGHTQLSDGVVKPIANLTVIGELPKSYIPNIKKVKPGQDIVMSKYTGIEGTYIALIENKDMLKKRFSSHFLSGIEEFKKELSVLPEAQVALEHGVSAMHDVSQGGIFKALWEIGSGSDLGLEVEFKKIPIKQETVEVTEVLDINPYQLKSGGSLLMITDDGKGLVDKLKSNGINAVLIGKMTKTNDRVLITDEGKRYLESN